MSHDFFITRPMVILLAVLHLTGCASATANDIREQRVLTAPPWVMQEGPPPTIVLQSGLGNDKSVWSEVMEELKDYAVFAYDRPGYGSNPASDKPRDPCTIATELHTLLRDAGLQPPYLLIGHSLGGLYQYAFALLYPTEVAGLVLLDPTHPHHWETMQRKAPTSASLIKAIRAVAFSRTERQEFDDQNTCLENLNALNLPNIQTRLLVSGRFMPMEQGDYLSMLKQLRQDWIRLVRAPRLHTIHDAGHYLQRDTPEEVAAAVRSLANNSLENAVGPANAQSHRQPPGIFPGRTTLQEIRKRYGEPGEKFSDGPLEIWAYDNRVKIPWSVSLIPVIGDIADAIELLWNLPIDEELIVQFDTLGIVKKASLRKLD